MRLFLSLTISVVFLASCSVSPSDKDSISPNGKRYPLKGTIVAVDRDKKRAKIEHESIEGFMEAMTMDFPIHADWVWENLTPGSEIRAELVLDSSAPEPYWLENIGGYTGSTSAIGGLAPGGQAVGRL